jgi:putative thioredoxin
LKDGDTMAEPGAVFEVTAQNFQTEVVERSASIPVVVLFWTDEVPPAAEARRQLETLAAGYPGKVAVGLSDVAQDQTLAQQLRVQGLPSIRVVQDGQLVDQLDGPQDEATLRELLDRLTVSSSDMLRAQLGEMLERGDHQTALAALQQAVAEEPNNQDFKVEYADLLALTGDLDQAGVVLAAIPEETAERDRPAMRLELLQEAAGMPERGELVSQLETSPEDLDVCYQLAVRAAVEGDFETALDLAMSILQRDREFRDDLGRTTMIRMFSALGKGSDLAARYRRRMFNFMH